MPDFEVTARRTIEQTCKFTVKAKDEDAAQEKAGALFTKEGWAAKQEWELENENIEVESIDEE